MIKWLALTLMALLNLGALAQETLYVGTYSVRGSKGIYVYSFDRATASFELIQTESTPESPTFLAISPTGNHLYSTNRGGTNDYPDWGSVSSFKIDEKTRKLSPLSEISSYGVSPCHVSVDDQLDWLYISHYGGGSLSVFPLQSDGSVGALADSVQHTGKSANPSRQDAPHVHAIQAIPESNYFITADLGLDELKLYEMKSQEVTPAPLPKIITEAGAGPRHFVQQPNSPYIYVAEELTSTVSVHFLDMDKQETRQIQRVSTLPEDYEGNNTVADIHLSPDGKYLYVSNRGHNSLAIFEVNPKEATLTPKGHQSAQGETPRNFTIDPQGEFILVANQDTDNIVFFHRDRQTGQLRPSDIELSVPSPVCLILTEPKD